VNETERPEKLQALLANTVSRTLFACISTPIDIENRWPPPVDVLAEHIKFMKGLEAEDRLFASGPFLDESGERTAEGLAILEVSDFAAAEDLIATDPLVMEGYRRVEIRSWQLNSTRKP
jgi:uncharacterized protein